MELVTYIHHITEYMKIARQNGFELVELKEWFDGNKSNEMPRLIGIVLIKKNAGPEYK